MTSEKNLMSPNSTNELMIIEESIPDDTVIWRYLKVECFVNIVNTHSIWFSRPFKFDDRWEGLFPPSYVRRTRQYATANGLSFKEFNREFHRRMLRHRYAHFVSCWHMNKNESDGMWRLYALLKTGIAIQSTVGDVKECLRTHNDGMVIYYDPSHKVLSPTIFGPHDILFKRKAFHFEQEYRFWFDDDELLKKIEAGVPFRKKNLHPGQLYPISNMQRLVKKIVVVPGASDKFIKKLQDVCAASQKRWLGKLIERSYSDRMWDSFTK
jgi:hypothetical protein